jgi:hypothetical protein
MVEIEVVEFLQKRPQRTDVGKISGLLALHGINEHLVKHAQFLRIVLGVKLDSLSHEILAHDVLEFIRMVLLVHHPSHALIAVLGFLTPQFYDLFHRFFDSSDMLGDHHDSHLIIVDPARDLTMGCRIGRGKKYHQKDQRRLKAFLLHFFPPVLERSQT